MNLYLLGLMVYLLLITPLRISFRLRAGRRPGYMLKVQAVGLPFYRRRKDEDPSDEKTLRQQDMTKQLKAENLRLIRILLSKPVRRALHGLVHVNLLSVYVHISQPDAAQTALLYGGLRAAVLPLIRQGALPFRIHLKADQLGQGSEVLIRCIISLRLGSLFPAMLVWLREYRRSAPQAAKEEKYAASH